MRTTGKIAAWLIGALASCALLGQGAAEPAPANCTEPDAALMRALVGWIGEHSSYDVSTALDELPVVRFCTSDETIPIADDLTIVEPGDAGVFDIEGRVIWLMAPWNPDNLKDVGVLLHELVHDIQFLNRSFRCPQAAEPEAYRLQELWLAEHGISFQVDPFFLFMTALCPPDIHP